MAEHYIAFRAGSVQGMCVKCGCGWQTPWLPSDADADDAWHDHAVAMEQADA